MKAKFILLGILIVALGLPLFNCSKDEEEDEIVEEPDYAGDWKGTTDSNLDVYFRVNSNHEIDSAKIYVTVNLITGTCTGLYLYKTTKLTPTKIKDDGSFEIILEGIQMTFSSGATAILAGKFVNNSSCTGYFNNISVYAIICGSSYIVGIGPEIEHFNWSTRKN